MSPNFFVVLLPVMLFTSWGILAGNDFADILPSADDPQMFKIKLNGPAEDQMFSPYRSMPDDHMCRPNPSESGSFCLNCDVYNCSNETTKDHLCLCQQGEFWQNCDNSSAKLPQNICSFVSSCGQFGTCVLDSKFGFKCKCDEQHAGELCDWDKAAFKSWHIAHDVIVILAVLHTVIAVIWAAVKHYRRRRVKITPVSTDRISVVTQISQLDRGNQAAPTILILG